MNFLIRRTSKKEYDGPASSASVVSGITDDPYLAAYSRKKVEMEQQLQLHQQTEERRRVSMSTISESHSSSQRSSSRGEKKSSCGHSDRKSSSSSSSASRPQSRSTSSSSQQRKSSDKQSQRRQQQQQQRNQPLASGISSRRTSHRVKNHLPAHMMSSRNPVASHPTITNKNNNCSVGSRSRTTTSRNSGDYHQRRSSGGDSSTYSTSHASSYYGPSISTQSKQIPMEHDGGILCLEPIPSSSGNSSKYRQGYDDGMTHRFLSGGADGTVKLWEVHEPPLDSMNEAASTDAQMIPRLVKTYRGHHGYVHSIAILGTFDPMENQKHESLDNIDNSSFASSPFSSPKRRGIFNRLSSTGSNESSQLKRLGRRKRDLFVTASRDNTLRIWELNNNNGHDEHFEGSGDMDYDDDEINSSGRKKDPLRKGKKLRGHAFGVSGGVLCVCAVPSLPSSSASMPDESNESIGEEDGMVSAGQFASGGADGVLRVYDVRSALNLEKVPKSGMYQTIQLQRLSPFSVHDGDSTTEDESTIGASVRSGESSRGAVAVTSVKCSPKQSERVGLFASYADGVIRRYSPVNGSCIGHGMSRAIHWCLTCVFEGHGHPITSLSLLSSQSLLQQEAVNDNDQPGTILISSSADGCIRVWDGSQVGCSEKSEEPIHISAALWEIELNDDDAGGENDCGSKCDRPPTSINVRTLVERVGVVSLTCFSEGLMMAAGTTDGAIRLWDVSSGLYEGAYNIGLVQVWSLSVLSERDIYEGYDEFGELKTYSAGIIISGDNRGRIRILRKTFIRESEIDQDDQEASRMFGTN